ncbi:MAG: hypothetical protein V3T33_01095 [Myxococcota bacterium]
MRLVSVLLALGIGIALAPGAAWAARITGACRRITRQIDHFETVGQMAQDRDDELWEEATRQHVGRLEVRRAQLCPEFAEQLRSRSRAARAIRQTKKFLKTAAKVAIRVFTLGAF